MTKLKIWLVCISLLLARWYYLPDVLPQDWTPESKIGYTMTVVNNPEYTDSKTLIMDGIWEIQIKGYTQIMPGSRVRFEGVVDPETIFGKVNRIRMIDPMVEIVGQEWNLVVVLSKLRENWVGTLHKTLPEPMASLAAGILLGVKGQMPYDFYQQLIKTGTLHVIAASGFNVMAVASVLMILAKKIFRRGVAVGVGVMGIVFYVLLSGASASVVRAGVMGSLTLIVYYFGRVAEARRLLGVSALAMLLFNPLYLVDVGFQLSVAATAGLLYIEPWLQKLDDRIKTPVGLQMFIGNYLYPTLAASIATLPVILWWFGRVSWISPLVNILILPLVPLIMLLSALTLVVGQPMAWILYPPLAWVVGVVGWLG